MTSRDAALVALQKQMEFELRDFYRLPINKILGPQLDAFLRRWEDNFSPYVTLKFTYKLDGQVLDITATIPEFTKYIIDLRKRGLSILDLAKDF